MHEMDSGPTAQTDNEITNFWDLEFSEATTVSFINQLGWDSRQILYQYTAA